MNPLLMIGIAPLSWRLGTVWHTHSKWVGAFGPLRLSLHLLPPGRKGRPANPKPGDKWMEPVSQDPATQAQVKAIILLRDLR